MGERKDNEERQGPDGVLGERVMANEIAPDTGLDSFHPGNPVVMRARLQAAEARVRELEAAAVLRELRRWIDAEADSTMDENRNFVSGYDEGRFDALEAVEARLDQLEAAVKQGAGSESGAASEDLEALRASLHAAQERVRELEAAAAGEEGS